MAEQHDYHVTAWRYAQWEAAFLALCAGLVPVRSPPAALAAFVA